MNFKGAPRVFWGWNGDTQKEEALFQLDDMRAKGICGVFVHARAGLITEYMGEQWMSVYESVLEHCKKIDMEVWIYDEYGWPSGFGGGKVCEHSEDFQEKYLNSRFCTLSELMQDLPQNRIYAVYDWNGAEFEQITDYAAGEHYFVYLTVNQYYIDVTNREAIEYFIQVVHEEYKKRFKPYFGNVIKGFFTDEPHLPPQGIPYGKYICEGYKNKDYSFEQAIPYMFYERGNYRKYRYDYWQLISNLFRENYVRVYRNWCKENNLVMTGHMACEDGLVDQIPVSGGMMPLYREMDLVGVDALGNRLIPPVVYKQAESIVLQAGKRNLMCETYAGVGYDASFAELLWIWAYQATFGVNVPCLSISMYSLVGNRKRDYPQFFSYQMPWWEKSDDLFHGIEYINDRLLEGAVKRDLAVFHPKTSVWCGRGYPYNRTAMDISAQFRILTENLLDLQLEFDYVDDDDVKVATVAQDGTLGVGCQKYRMLILPEMTDISSGSIEVIRRFAEAGGKVIVVNRYPDSLDGADASIDFSFAHDFAVNRREYLRKYFRIHLENDAEFIERETRSAAFGLSVTKRYLDGAVDLLAVNKSRNNGLQVCLRSAGKNAVVQTAVTGEEKTLCSRYCAAENCTYTDVTFDPLAVFFFRISPSAQTVACEKIVSARLLDGAFTPLPSQNTFTVDRLCYSIDGGPFSEEDFSIFQNTNLYKTLNELKRPVKLQVKYRFFSDRITGVKLACESLGGKVFVNGIALPRAGYFLDKDIALYEIGNACKEGENVILLEREIPSYSNELFGKDVFQSVTNIESFPYSLENAYLIGDFAVQSLSAIEHSQKCVFTRGGFYLSKTQTPYRISDLYSAERLFYCGKAEFESTVEIPEDRQAGYRLRIDEFHAVCGELNVNGNVMPLGACAMQNEITPYLHAGKNHIRITLYSSLRNLFGPLHHVYGKHYYTGPSVFSGYKEWQDKVIYPELGNDTWTDDYSFISFGAKGIYLVTYQKGE